MILDLSDIKTDLTYKHFKMESLQTAMDIMQKGGFMASVDLADSYYLVPIAEEDRKYPWVCIILPVEFLQQG